jgi:hypothetical protein
MDCITYIACLVILWILVEYVNLINTNQNTKYDETLIDIFFSSFFTCYDIKKHNVVAEIMHTKINVWKRSKSIQEDEIKLSQWSK